ncbi:MAG: radical SAM/SPASM domain-containing protein [Candidatus Eremiobacteraeota bacterium]|nr:radical SAM/SPASM domain-containing protein [Candidatus Eremiobacteraeota bacterium]
MDTSKEARKIQAKDLRCRERQPLEEVIPLPAPFVVYVEPANLCNFKCIFCPTGDSELIKKVGRPSGVMSMELFSRIVENLKEFGVKLKLLSLYKDGEPLVNRHFPLMVHMAKEAAIAEKIWTKTNGALLNPALNEEIIDAGLDMICISVEAVTAEGYRKVSGVDIDYDAFRENIRDLYRRRGKCELYIKILDYGLSEEELDKFYSDFKGIGDFVGVEKPMGWSYSSIKDFTLGTNPDTYDGLPFTPKEVCAYPFYVLAINFNGTVSLCGNDWSHSTVVGDVTRESLREIWHGRRLFRFRKMMLEGRRHENRACGDCYYLKIVPDNIDDHRAMILEKLEKARREE